MLKYEKLSDETSGKIESDRKKICISDVAFDKSNVIRRYKDRDKANIIRTAFIRDIPYEETEPNQIVVDYIASMTDDYFIELYHHLFPNSDKKIEYKGYFD